MRHGDRWATRFATMGDIAERVFMDEHGERAVPLGLSRPPWNVGGMPTDEMRSIPDFVMKKHFVEVMGCGRDRTLKLKLDKLRALEMWDMHIGPVLLWVYNSVSEETWCAHITDWSKACARHADIKRFEDNNKPYYSLYAEWFPKGVQP